MSLDADEVVSDELRDSILNIKSGHLRDAYRFNRLNNYCGRWIRHGTWYPDRKIRLWRKDSGRWGGENPHDRVVLNEAASVGFLPGDLLHYTASTPQEWLDQIERFSAIQAHHLRQQNVRPNLFHHIIKPSFRFLQSYLLRGGFLDGKAGWEIAWGQARMVRQRYEKLDASYDDVKPD